MVAHGCAFQDDSLANAASMWSVDSHLKCLTAVLELRAGTWDDRDWFRNYMEAEGHKETYVLTSWARLQARTAMSQKQRSGDLSKNVSWRGAHVSEAHLANEQLNYYDSIVAKLQTSVQRDLDDECEVITP